MRKHYPEESLDPDEDDGTMVESKKNLEQAIIGRRIVAICPSVDVTHDPYGLGRTVTESGTQLVLDNGRRVTLIGQSDCCAFTHLGEFLLHTNRVEHAITGVGTENGYTTWHILCDAGDVATLEVGWSCGNPFYYAYGFTIVVQE